MIRNKRRYTEYLLILATVIAMGCEGERVTEKLEQIDSLLVHDQVDSALVRLSDLDLSFFDQADSAYYYLIQTEAHYRANALTLEDSIVNYSLKYYERSHNNEKKARAHYYNSVTSLYLNNNLTTSIFLIKQAEGYAEQTNDLLLKHKIYEKLAYYNGRAYEYKLALLYAKKALRVARVLNDKNRQAIALIYMAGYYHGLGQMDSLAVCVQECLPLTDYIREIDKAYLYSRIGELYAETEPDLAKKYLQKAIDIHPQLWACLALSNVYLKDNDYDRAQEIWTGALQMNESTKGKLDILKAMRQQCLERKDFKQANGLADSIIEMEGRFYEGLRKNQIAEIQAKYDKETAVRDLREKYMTGGFGLLALVTIVVVVLGYKSRQGMKARKELAETRLQLEAYTKRAVELESSGKANASEINRLHEKINELTHRHSGILAKGKELYDAIKAGGTTVRWGKDDFINFLEYYKMKDLPFVNEMETGYNRLSPKYIFFAVLEHEGYHDKEIQRIMGVSESTLRSTRSRINSKRNS